VRTRVRRDTVIIFGIAVAVLGWFLSIPILGTTGGILLTVGLIVWILRQSQSVVLVVCPVFS
jgi:hypothetical protein